MCTLVVDVLLNFQSTLVILSLCLLSLTTWYSRPMSHIADLYNDGRTGRHQSIDQARGCYAQLIEKEARVADAAHTRWLLQLAGVRCPACSAPVSTARCHICKFFPIPLPSKRELDALDEEFRKSHSLPAVHLSGSRHRGSSVSSRSSVGSRTPSQRSHSVRSYQRSQQREAVQRRIDLLEQELNEEKSVQSKILEKISSLQATLERSLPPLAPRSSTPLMPPPPSEKKRVTF